VAVWATLPCVPHGSEQIKTKVLLQAYLTQGVQRVLVTAPVKQSGVLDIVMGVNHHLYDSKQHQLVTGTLKCHSLCTCIQR